jgi:hypothetical protein
LDDVAPDVITHALNDRIGSDVNDKPRAAQMIGDNPVGDAALDHVGRHVAFVGIDETADDRVVAVQFGGGFELILIQEALFQHAVDFFADAAVLAVDQVIDGGAIGQIDMPQITQYIVVVGGCRCAYGPGFQFAIGSVGGIVVVEQPVLVVVVGDGLAVDFGTVAVVVIAIAGLYDAIQLDFDQPAGRIEGVVEGAGAAAYGFYFLGNPSQFIAGEVGFVQV